MKSRWLAIAGGIFAVAALRFVVRKRLAQYPGEDVWAMKAAALCGLAAILLLVWAQAVRRKEQP